MMNLIPMDQASCLHWKKVSFVCFEANLYENLIFLFSTDHLSGLNREKLPIVPLTKFIHWKIDQETVEKLKRSNRKVKFVTADQLLQEPLKFIKFNLKSLDNIMEGGIDFSSVTEISGEAGVGKTQLCLQLALNCQIYPEIGGTCVYISCGKRIPVKRLKQMADSLKSRQRSRKVNDINFLKNILIYETHTADKLIKIICNHLELVILMHSKVSLVVIDSIADIFRYEDDYIQRAIDMRKTALTLRSLSEKYGFAIVCVNQIVSKIGTFYDELVSSLGPTWKSLVSTKLKITKTSEIIEENPVRLMEVTHSPRLRRDKGKFIITDNGIQEYN
jgi:RecA/RadA recombinase